MTLFSLFAGADLIGEFETRQDAERALDELIAADPEAADELAVFEFDENGERVGGPITRAAANAPRLHGYFRAEIARETQMHFRKVPSRKTTRRSLGRESVRVCSAS